MSRSDEFQEFRDWLRYDGPKLISSGTVNCYVSNLRRVMRDAPSLDQAGLDAFFESQVASLSGNVSNYRTAWSKFAQFNKEKKGVDLPLPSDRREITQRLRQGQSLIEDARPEAPPDDVLRVVFFMMRTHRIELNHIENMTWEGVRRQNPARTDLGYTVRVPDQKFSIRLSSDQRDVLRAYAQPTQRMAALIPDRPGSMYPYPAFWLKYWLNQAKRRAVFETQEPNPVEERLGNASASVDPNVSHWGFTLDGQPLVADNALFDQRVQDFHHRPLSHLQDREKLPKFRDTAELIEYLQHGAAKPRVGMLRDDAREVGQTGEMQFYESDGWFEFPRAD